VTVSAVPPKVTVGLPVPKDDPWIVNVVPAESTNAFWIVCAIGEDGIVKARPAASRKGNFGFKFKVNPY
jgi:hypothetical protein